MPGSPLTPPIPLAVVGLGALGLPMAVNLHNAGYALRVHTRSRNAEQDPALSGSRACATPAEAVAGCSALLLCVSDDEAVDAVLWGEQGAGHALAEGSVVIDCSTISPAQAQAMAARLKSEGIHYIDCLLYTSPSPRDKRQSRMPSSA